jgi:putative transposase
MVMTIEELAQILIRYIVDVYHNRPHAGLGGASPRSVFEKGVRDYQLLLPPSNEELQHIFGAMVRRKVTNRGVRVLGLHYQSSELQRARRQPGFREVDVRIDENDLGAVSVRIKDGWISVPCSIDMTGQDVDTWVEAQNALRRNNAQVTAMSATTVQNATRDIAQFIDAKTKRSGISSPLFTTDKADQFERDIFKGFDIARDASHNADIIEEALGQDDGDSEQEFDLAGNELNAESSNPEGDMVGDEDEWTVE